MAKSNDPVAKRVVIEYDNGSTKELDKRAVWHFEEAEGSNQVQITAELIHMTGRDFYTVIDAAIEMGVRLGMLNGLEDAGDD